MFKHFRTRFYYDQDGGAAGGAGQGQGQGQGGAGSGQGQGGGQAQPFATFPDEATFNARLKREGKAQMEALAKEMGFDSLEAFQSAAKAKKELDDKSKTDLEKEKIRADNAENEKKTALETAKTIAINAEIKVFAMQAGFVDPADATVLVDRSTIQVDDKGIVSGAKEAVEALAKAKPHLIGKQGAGGSPGSLGNGNRQGGGGGEDNEFAANLAKKRDEQNKAAGAHQNHYFK